MQQNLPLSMQPTQFCFEMGLRTPINRLESHLIKVASLWCQGQSVTPIRTLADFRKRLESEAAWFCRDNYHHDPTAITTVLIGQYDETMLFIKPADADVRATAVIRLVKESQPVF